MHPLGESWTAANRGRKAPGADKEPAGQSLDVLPEQENDENVDVSTDQTDPDGFGESTSASSILKKPEGSACSNIAGPKPKIWKPKATRRYGVTPARAPEPTPTSLGPSKHDGRPSWDKSGNWRAHSTQFYPQAPADTSRIPKFSRADQKNTTFSQASAQAVGRLDAKSSKFSRITQALKRNGTEKKTTFFGKSTKGSGGVWGKGRRTRDTGTQFSQFKPGTITWHEEIHAYGCDTVAEGDEDKIIEIEGRLYYKKGRYWLVISRTRYEITEVPINSFDNTGLSKKDPKTWQDYLVLCPKGLDPQSLQVYCADKPILEIASLIGSEHQLGRLTMVVHFTKLTTRDIDVPNVRIAGNLQDFSTEDLVAAVRERLGKVPSPEDEF